LASETSPRRKTNTIDTCQREAKYWHGRAVEENPGVRISSEEALRRIGELPVEHLLISD
jgi:hypothetical protein